MDAFDIAIPWIYINPLDGNWILPVNTPPVNGNAPISDKLISALPSNDTFPIFLAVANLVALSALPVKEPINLVAYTFDHLFVGIPKDTSLFVYG